MILKLYQKPENVIAAVQMESRRKADICMKMFSILYLKIKKISTKQ
jgi:hypothetical protein